MNFVFHELIQLSSVINMSEREAGSFEARQTKRSSYIRFMYVCPPSRPIIRFERLSKYDFKAVFEV